MARVKRGVNAKRRHKKVLKQAKGYFGANPSFTELQTKQLCAL